jgi:hypothetical protein
MTKNEATRVLVRVEAAVTGLREAIMAMLVAGGGEEEIGESLEEALQAAETAQAALKNIIGF